MRSDFARCVRCVLGAFCGGFFLLFRERMDRLLAQHDLEAVMTSVIPLLPFLSRKSCEEGTTALVKLLGKGLEAQQAASERVGELKNLKSKDLMTRFTPDKRDGAGTKQKDAGSKERDKEKGDKEGEAVDRLAKKRVRKAGKMDADEGEQDQGDEPSTPVKKLATKKRKGVKKSIDPNGWNGEEV